MWRYLLFVSLFASLPLQTPNCGCEDQPQVNILAVVNGIKITKQDLSIDTRTRVSLAQDLVINARAQQLEKQINHVLLESEAKRRGLSALQLVEVEVNAKIIQPTEEELRALYEASNKRPGRDFKSVKNEFIAQIRLERETLRARAYASALRAGAQITGSTEPVTPPANEGDLSRVFATVNGVNITSRDIEQSLRPLIAQVQQQVYALRKQDLDLKINDILLEQEAKRLGTTPKALIDQNVSLRLSIVTEEQALAFYNANKTNLNRDFASLKFQILQHLMAQEQRKLVLAYAEQLRKGASVQIYLTPPESR